MKTNKLVIILTRSIQKALRLAVNRPEDWADSITDDSPWESSELLSKKKRDREGTNHNQTQQWQQATSIIIIISHHVYIAIMLFVAQSAALIRKRCTRKRGKGEENRSLIANFSP
jgi:hypothetical protein